MKGSMSNKNKQHFIPVIDLFAGPGGLNEGFSHEINGELRFKSVLSVEKESAEHLTLSLRAFYRFFRYHNMPVPVEYYDYIQRTSKITRAELWKLYPEAAEEADQEALQYTLGTEDELRGFSFLENKIKKALNNEKDWLLIGGPPCQAYSIAGRSKQIGEFKKTEGSISGAKERFFKDHRHNLYRQYLRIIAVFSPAVFVMENVKGILSAKLGREPIFPKILADLRTPHESAKEYGWDSDSNHVYHIVSFVTGSEPEKLSDYLIKSEEYGIPQARHRVILLGIRDDIWEKIGQRVNCLNQVKKQTSVFEAIGKLPVLRSGITGREDSLDAWRRYLAAIEDELFFSDFRSEVREAIQKYTQQRKSFSAGRCSRELYEYDGVLDNWYYDSSLKYHLNHETRAHMASDLYRYLYVAVEGELQNRSPQLRDFPNGLLPDHKNVIKETDKKTRIEQKFADRFKVQIWEKPSSTITSHISKDGHYFIHPDPVQCRSLTVREAARLQTFPDNYFLDRKSVV